MVYEYLQELLIQYRQNYHIFSLRHQDDFECVLPRIKKKCLYEQWFACNYQIMALTPEHNQLYPHIKNTLEKSSWGNQTNHMIMGETKNMLFVVSLEKS